MPGSRNRPLFSGRDALNIVGRTRIASRFSVPAGKSQHFAASLQHLAAADEDTVRHMIIARTLAFVIALSASATTRASESDVPRPQIPDHTFRITDFGAVGDGAALNTDGIAK